MFTRLVLLFFATTLVLSPIMAQTTAPARDPRALNLIASSLNALSGSVSVNDATLQATAAYVAGSDQESGGAILIGHVNQESIVQLSLSGGTRQEIRNGPAGAWSGPDATVPSRTFAVEGVERAVSGLFLAKGSQRSALHFQCRLHGLCRLLLGLDARGRL
jgi:hypothetical protein